MFFFVLPKLYARKKCQMCIYLEICLHLAVIRRPFGQINRYKPRLNAGCTASRVRFICQAGTEPFECRWVLGRSPFNTDLQAN